MQPPFSIRTKTSCITACQEHVLHPAFLHVSICFCEPSPIPFSDSTLSVDQTGYHILMSPKLNYFLEQSVLPRIYSGKHTSQRLFSSQCRAQQLRTFNLAPTSEGTIFRNHQHTSQRIQSNCSCLSFTGRMLHRRLLSNQRPSNVNQRRVSICSLFERMPQKEY